MKTHSFGIRGMSIGLCLIGIAASAGASTLEEANAAYSTGKYKQAVGLYRKAVKEGESPALCFYNAANASFQLDNLPQAIVYYRACVQAAPDYAKAYLNLAVCYYTVNDMGQCIATGTRALSMEPTNQKTLLLLATAYRRCGATAKAVVTYENLARIYPLLEDPYIALGEMYRELDDQDESIKWLLSYPESGKNLEYVYTLLADQYEKIGDHSREIFYLNRAFELDKTKRWTLYRIAAIQSESGNDLVALETCRDGLHLFPDFADLAVLAGTISFQRERIEDAERFYTVGAQYGSPAAVVGLTNVRAWRKSRQTAME